MAGPGRNPVAAMERLVRLVGVLSAAGDSGVPMSALVRVGEYGEGSEESHKTQVQRDIRHLQALGMAVSNVADLGDGGRYVLHVVDTRLRLALTERQQAALRRAALAVNRADLAAKIGPDAEPPDTGGIRVQPPAPPEHLDVVLDAVRRRRLLRFDYKGTARVVHPYAVRPENGVWYLTGPDGSGTTKHFHVGRMSAVRAEAPGTATSAEQVPRVSLDPMEWARHDPVEVLLRVPAPYEPDATRLLGAPRQREERGAEVLLGYRVTNEDALLDRVIELGERVVLVGPDEVRARLRDRLQAVVDA
jgi:predicted DNA-binding transcriptional regulator YafY